MTSVLMSCAAAVGSSDNGHRKATQQPRVQNPQHAEVSIRVAQHDGEDRVQEPPAWRQGAVLLLCWGVFVMFTLLLSHYHRCSPAYWSIFAVQAATCIGAEALFIRLVSLPLLLPVKIVQVAQWSVGKLRHCSRRSPFMKLETACICYCLGMKGQSAHAPSVHTGVE